MNDDDLLGMPGPAMAALLCCRASICCCCCCCSTAYQTIVFLIFINSCVQQTCCCCCWIIACCCGECCGLPCLIPPCTKGLEGMLDIGILIGWGGKVYTSLYTRLVRNDITLTKKQKTYFLVPRRSKKLGTEDEKFLK